MAEFEPKEENRQFGLNIEAIKRGSERFLDRVDQFLFPSPPGFYESDRSGIVISTWTVGAILGMLLSLPATFALRKILPSWVPSYAIFFPTFAGSIALGASLGFRAGRKLFKV